MIFVFMLALCGCTKKPEVVHNDSYLVGAHYYSWYPNNWGSGCLIRLLDPEQRPWLGYYNSWDKSVIEQHIAWCSQYGIDFLTIDWWPNRENHSRFLKDAFLRADNIADIRFCIFYETQALNFDPAIAATTFDDETTDRFVKNMREIGEDFFDHPSYLKVNGRPVVILYLARTFAGDFRRAITKARRELTELGYEVYFIGDEVFWKVSPVVGSDERPYPLVSEPQRRRIKCFDAITSYNMYESEISSHAGYASESDYMKDVKAIYSNYVDAAGADVHFVPQIIPGYNDRAGRLVSDHHVMPRRWSKGSEEGSFFEESFDDIAFRYLDPKLNMMLITSWNEWVEYTSIEPLTPSADTSVVRGPAGTEYTCGYKYSGYGMKYLEIVRNKVAGIYGRVTDADGKGCSGVTVTVTCGGLKLQTKTDSKGYYIVSRLKLQPGECAVTVERCDPKVANILKGSASEVNFTLPEMQE